MAVNKNFVVKNGIEVNDNLIFGDADNKNVGIASTTPNYTLDVAGGIGATDLVVTGFTTITKDLQVGASGSTFYVSNSNNLVGVGTSVPAYLLDVRSSVSTGQTALYVYGDMRVTGDINVDDITFDDAYVDQLYVAGLSTFVGVSTHTGQSFFNDVQVSGAGTVTGDLTVGGDLNVTGDITYDEVTGRNIYISGLSTFVGVSTHEAQAFFGDVQVSGASTFTGVGTFISDLYVGGNLNVTGDISYDEVTGRNIDITGISTFEGLVNALSNVGVGTTNPTAAADSNNTTILNAGIVTANYYYGDGSNITNVTATSGGAIGLASEGTYIGAGVTTLDLKSSNGTAWTISETSSGFATATITPGVSIGLAIALGG
mgnify:CR=1 FL=1|tara:strand:- start:593 stop:1708 length:1116 start_codon:yes stop_codon:yes gene_type:complete